MREQEENQPKIRSARREVLGEVYGRSLGEVFQAFPIYNSLILRSLSKTTGGLGEKHDKGKSEDWKFTNLNVISFEPKSR